MNVIHKDGQIAGAWSSRRGVFTILVLVGVVVLMPLVGACAAPAGGGGASSPSAVASIGASGGAGTSSAGTGSAGTGSAPSPSAITDNRASIGGDSVQPPSVAVSVSSPEEHILSGLPSGSFSTSSNPSCPPPESPGPESAGQACPTPPSPSPTPTTLTPTTPPPAPASGLAGVFSLSGFAGRMIS